jgi:lipoyl(octanoyl) transferase
VATAPLIRRLGRVDYAATVEAMRAFTEARDEHTPDEIWLCEHAPVYTQGVAGKAEHVLDAHGIPVVQTNRGGQVTYHGPGQVVAYPLIDLRRLGIFVKEYVFRLENAVLRTLERHGVTGHRVRGAPGIYVRLDYPFGHAHRTYHGVALNVAMDLSPFDGINPCGYAGLATVDLAKIGVSTDWDSAARMLGDHLAAQFAR